MLQSLDHKILHVTSKSWRLMYGTTMTSSVLPPSKQDCFPRRSPDVKRARTRSQQKGGRAMVAAKRARSILSTLLRVWFGTSGISWRLYSLVLRDVASERCERRMLQTLQGSSGGDDFERSEPVPNARRVCERRFVLTWDWQVAWLQKISHFV